MLPRVALLYDYFSRFGRILLASPLAVDGFFCTLVDKAVENV